MEKMENIVFDRNYEEDKPDPLAQAIFDRVNAPGGFLEEFSKKMDAIPKVIVPKDKENYEYLLERCDEFAKRHHGKIHGVVDFEHWDAHIDLTLPMLEFDDSEDMSLLKDIGEKAHYCCITTQEDGKFRFHVTLFIITTDGMENASRFYSSDRVKQMIQRQKTKYGWEFLFLGANIDAVETARHFGIGADRAVNYNSDSAGTQLNYEVLNDAISAVRSSAPLGADWKSRIDEDYEKRGKGEKR